MEFQPDGMVNLMLVLPDGTKENYTWNKVRFENNNNKNWILNTTED